MGTMRSLARGVAKERMKYRGARRVNRNMEDWKVFVPNRNRKEK